MDGGAAALRRAPLVLAVIAAVALSVGVRSSAPRAQRTDVVLHPWAGHEAAVVWVFRRDDLPRCRTAAPLLRRVNHGFGRDVAVSAVGVDVDTAWTASFLRVERIRGGAMSISPSQAARWFGDGATPALFVVRRGRILRRIDAGVRGPGGAEAEIRAALSR